MIYLNLHDIQNQVTVAGNPLTSYPAACYIQYPVHPSSKIGLQEQKLGRDAGAVSGVIKVDKGPLIGALVTFHRR